MSDRPKVLLVEDEPLLREIVMIELEDAGYEVVEAECGDDAVAMIEGGTRFDLLLTDIRLPGAADGWAVARCARAIHPHMPVIYASGYSGGAMCPVEGAQFVPKPFLPSAMVEVAASFGLQRCRA